MPAMHLGVDVGESVEDVVDRVCEGLRRRACRKRQPASEMRSGTPAAKHRAGHKRGSAPQCAACTDCCRSVNVRERQRGAANMNGGRGGERGTAVFQAALVVHEPLCYFWHRRRPTTRRSRAAELRTRRRRRWREQRGDSRSRTACRCGCTASRNGAGRLNRRRGGPHSSSTSLLKCRTRFWGVELLCVWCCLSSAPRVRRDDAFYRSSPRTWKGEKRRELTAVLAVLAERSSHRYLLSLSAPACVGR